MDSIPASQTITPFAQQGTIDWTALSRTSFSASLAVLGRLSGAGLEPLTVAIVQAMCINIPIGIHGEERLQESISTLKAFSSFGDVIWFGVGVRHVLRTLVQTSEGASGVALAACLSEGHSPQYSARVFYDLAKLMKSPTELTPSFVQWENYVRACSGIFGNSNFGLKVSQMTRLAGFSTFLQTPEAAPKRAAQPAQMAEILRAIGMIQTEQWESIQVTGGSECCWTIVLCEFLFGLRVELRGLNGNVLFQNYNVDSQQAQVYFDVCQFSEYSLCRTGRTFALNPMDFVARWHTEGYSSDSHLVTSRQHQSVIIQECFGKDFMTFTGESLAQMLAASAVLYSGSSRSWGYNTPEDFVNKAITSIPELSALASSALSEIEKVKGEVAQLSPESSEILLRNPFMPDKYSRFIAQEGRKDDADIHGVCASTLYKAAMSRIKALCDCGHHPHRCSKVTACSTIIILAYFLGNLVMDDELTMSRLGLGHVYETLFEASIDFESVGALRSYLMLSNAPGMCGNDIGTDFADSFQLYLHLFSGYTQSSYYSSTIRARTSAMAYNGLYCYIDLLREPYQTYENASRIHIGRGSIHTTARVYPIIVDQDDDRLYRSTYDYKPPDIPMARALVDENVTLRFWYEQWDGQAVEERRTANPMACLAVGWDGSKGAWKGTSWLKAVPLSYIKGTLPRSKAQVMEQEQQSGPRLQPRQSPELQTSKRSSRKCSYCKSPGHDVRTCLEKKE
ncbi:hypothetical protein MMC27_008777 [Xylographa pallens]|nr:hypothetical protein [Xylographa pallens]